MARLNKERQEKLEPERIKFALEELSKVQKENSSNLSIIGINGTCIELMFKSFLVRYYPYSGWHTGKSIKDGRGWKNLKKQLIEQ